MEDLSQEQVDQAIGGIQKKNPADGEKDVGDHHWDDGDDPEEEFEGDIGSGIKVGQEQSQKGGDKGGANSENNRVDNDASESRICVGLNVLFQGELAECSNTLREASENKHDHGTYSQKSDNRYKTRRQCRSGIEHFPVHFESTKQ